MKKLYTYVLYIVAAMALSSCATPPQSSIDDVQSSLIDLSMESIEVDCWKSIISDLHINTNYPYSVSSDVEWISWSNNGSIVVEQNNTVTERIGHLIVTVKDESFGVEYSKKVKITQRRGMPQVYAYLKGYESLGNNINIKANGGSSTLCVVANFDWTINIDCDWITCYTYGGEGSEDVQEFLVVFEENGTSSGRRGRIELMTQDEFGGNIYTISFYQSGVNLSWEVTGAGLSDNMLNLPATTSTQKLTIETNLSWEVKVVAYNSWDSTNWIRLDRTSCTLNKFGEAQKQTLNITFAENTTGGGRLAYIVIYSKEYGNPDSNSGNTTRIFVQQNPAPDAYIENHNIFVKPMAGEYSAKFSLATSWTATTNSDWLTISNPNGTAESESIQFSATENNTGSMRDATITISANEYESLKYTITIKQDHKNVLYYTCRNNSTALTFSPDAFDSNIVEHTYECISEENRIYEGRVVFDSKLWKIGDRAFSGEYITSIVIPESVTSIGDEAFYNCGYLSSIELPKSVSSIGERAFLYCSSLTEITIPSGVTRIEQYTFSECSQLEKIDIPATVAEIGDSAFYNCAALKSLNIPNGVWYIAAYTFFNCASLESVNIPNTVTSLGDYAFYGCTSLKEIVVPSGVEKIPANTFYNCSSLATVTLPASLKTIDYGAFALCSTYKKVYFGGTFNEWNDIDFYNENSNPLYSGRGSLYLNGSEELTEIKRSTSENVDFSPYAFRGCTSLKTIVLGSRSVPAYAFEKSGLTTVTFGAGSLGEGVFSSCSDLTTLRSSGDSKYEIPKKAFYKCTTLRNVTICPTSTIGESAFEGCRYLTKVVIEENSFCNNCKDLVIGRRAFYDCHIIFSEFDCSGRSRVQIGNEAFYDCGSLETVKFPSNEVYFIGQKAFYGCDALKSISISGTTDYCTISESAFENCNLLAEITLRNILKIQKNVFSGCSAIQTVTCKNTTPPTGNSGMFPSPTTYTYKIVVPSASLSKYKNAQYWSDYKDLMVGQ